MSALTIRPAETNEYDEIARVRTESWASAGLERASEAMHAESRARIPEEVAGGWSLYVADDARRIAAVLAFRLRNGYLDQLFVDPAYQGQGIGKMLLQFARIRSTEL